MEILSRGLTEVSQFRIGGEIFNLIPVVYIVLLLLLLLLLLLFSISFRNLPQFKVQMLSHQVIFYGDIYRNLLYTEKSEMQSLLVFGCRPAQFARSVSDRLSVYLKRIGPVS